ncbi:MAG TPA: hypothetical protein VGR31_02015 [Planctomycetota bacterium]|jgi:hypothetical protein|nr:hypothetical protein [Planctomycetota bacterium]
MSAENSESVDRPSGAVPTLCAAALAIALGVWWTRGMVLTRSLGWDESMHADLPAVRMLLALKRGEVHAAFDALLGCSQYPFVFPVVLAVVQGIFGIGEAVCRATGTVLWCTTLFGLFLLGRELAGDQRERSLAPWIGMAFGALSPMALAFAGTLFLEIPFACASVFALRAWLRRGSRPGRGSEIAAGAWIAVAVFTKFNYGLLLGFGLALDWVCEAVVAARAGAFAAFARRSAALVLVPALSFAWWFLLPLPGGVDVGLEHRRALVAFLSGNQGWERVPYPRRLLDASAWLTLTPRLFVVLVLAALAAVRVVSRPGVRALVLVFLSMAVPTLAHPFHLDRFLIPIAIPLWALAGLGLARTLPAHRVLRPALLAALALLTIPFPARAAVRAAGLLGALSADPRVRDYQEAQCRLWSDLSPTRTLPTNGLEARESDRILEILAREAGPNEHVGWFGVSTNLAPAAIHLGLLARGGSVERFLRDAAAPMDVAYFGDDPAWSDDELAAFASRFDVVFSTEPQDIKGRPGRAWTRAYRDRLVQKLGWNARLVGSVAIERPLSDSLTVTVLACRPTR